MAYVTPTVISLFSTIANPIDYNIFYNDWIFSYVS